MSELYSIKFNKIIMANSTAGVLTKSTGSFSKTKAFTIIAHIARVILGLIFFVFGLNGFLHFIPMTSLPKGAAGEFVYGLAKSAYFLPFMAAIQFISGVLLLSGSLIPFALLMLFPISINIFLYHAVLSPEGLGMAVFILAAHTLLAVYYWPVYQAICKTANAWRGRISVEK
jgi:putative oxidoreductase